jgi:hypothetical protein
MTPKEWSASHKEHLKEYHQSYFQEHKDEVMSQQAEYRHKNRETVNAKARQRARQPDRRHHKNEHLKASRISLREESWQIYGARCRCCGEDEKRFLTLHHINGGGASERKRRGALTVLRDAVKNPNKTKYEVLCFNCHLGAHANGGVCPHLLKPKVL